MGNQPPPSPGMLQRNHPGSPSTVGSWQEVIRPSDHEREDEFARTAVCTGRSDAMRALDTAVTDCLASLARGMEAAHTHPAKQVVPLHNSQVKLLHAFGVSPQAHPLCFDLQVHADVGNWMRLYATAIRCSVEPRERGFVYLEWDGMFANGAQWGHSTVLYFDIPQKRQVFLDPSGALRGTIEAGNV